MACGNNGMSTRINLSGEVLEEVESFVYLGSIFTSDSNCTQDIRTRLAMGRSAMQSLSSVWKSKDISTNTNVRLLKALVWSTAIYGSEAWTLRSKEEKYIEVFRMRCYRRLLWIPWTQYKTNERTLCELKVDRELLERVKSLKFGFYGHTTRKYESLEKQTVQGCVPGYRNRGRQRRHWTDDIT